LAAGEIRITGHVYQEILNGIGKGFAGRYRKIRNHLKDYVIVPTREDYENAIELGRKCTWEGKTLSITDLMNCSISVSKGWAILSLDKDYIGAKKCDSRVKLVEFE
jgi:hypothetical protein